MRANSRARHASAPPPAPHHASPAPPVGFIPRRIQERPIPRSDQRPPHLRRRAPPPRAGRRDEGRRGCAVRLRRATRSTAATSSAQAQDRLGCAWAVPVGALPAGSPGTPQSRRRRGAPPAPPAPPSGQAPPRRTGSRRQAGRGGGGGGTRSGRAGRTSLRRWTRCLCSTARTSVS